MRIFSGQRAWLLQRLSAVVLLILLVLAAVTLAGADGSAYERWRALAASAHGAVLIVVFFVAIGVHGWIGARDVVLDYVKAPALRLSLLALVGVVLVAIPLRVVLILVGNAG